ncbi:MAG TPA: methyltransferase domain-containing protein [Acidobacteriota bacterium]|nr:methyltransferase domain-containing protein [Acidobacteriota bacterium]
MNVDRATLDLGCGRNKLPGAVGLDRVGLRGVDVVHDLNQPPFPFADNSFHKIRLIHVIEHLESILKVMEEVHRLGKPGCRVTIVTPHHTDAISWQDPTHRWHLNGYSFSYFDPDYRTNYYSPARFRLVSHHQELASIWKVLGLQALINLDNLFPAVRFVRRFWEQHLCFLLRGKQMTFVLEVLK